jgi:hypothetical protein
MIKDTATIRVSESRHIAALSMSANRRLWTHAHSECGLAVVGGCLDCSRYVLTFEIVCRERNRFRKAGSETHGRTTTSLGPEGRTNFAPRS